MPTTRKLTPRNHRIVSYKGKRVCLSEACRLAGLNPNKVRSRLHLGWSIPEALELKYRKPQQGWVKGRKKSDECRAKMRISQQRRRQQQRQTDLERFLTNRPSITSEPLMMLKQFYDKESV